MCTYLEIIYTRYWRSVYLQYSTYIFFSLHPNGSPCATPEVYAAHFRDHCSRLLAFRGMDQVSPCLLQSDLHNWRSPKCICMETILAGAIGKKNSMEKKKLTLLLWKSGWSWCRLHLWGCHVPSSPQWVQRYPHSRAWGCLPCSRWAEPGHQVAGQEHTPSLYEHSELAEKEKAGQVSQGCTKL